MEFFICSFSGAYFGGGNLVAVTHGLLCAESFPSLKEYLCLVLTQLKRPTMFGRYNKYMAVLVVSM